MALANMLLDLAKTEDGRNTLIQLSAQGYLPTFKIVTPEGSYNSSSVGVAPPSVNTAVPNTAVSTVIPQSEKSKTIIWVSVGLGVFLIVMLIIVLLKKE